MSDKTDITGGFGKLKSDLKKMNLRQKVEHLWTYHKGFLFAVVAVSVLVAVLVSILDSASKSTLLSGVTVNVQVSDAGAAYLQEQYKAHLGVESDRKVVYFNQSTVEGASDTANMDNYYMIQTLNALCDNGEIDYMLLDQVAFEVLLTQSLLADLSAAFTDEQLQDMTGMLAYCQTEEEGVTPIALDITDTAFVRENTDEDGKVYFVLAAGSPRTEAARDLLAYLLAWEKTR